MSLEEMTKKYLSQKEQIWNHILTHQCNKLEDADLILIIDSYPELFKDDIFDFFKKGQDRCNRLKYYKKDENVKDN